MKRLASRLVRGLCGLLGAAAMSAANAGVAVVDAGTYVGGGFADRVDLAVRDGYDRPDEALTRLDALAAGGEPSSSMQRVLLQARGAIEAQAGQAGAAGRQADALLVLSQQADDPLAAAASSLVRALAAESADQLDVAAALARPALEVYKGACGEAAKPDKTCDYRSAWRSLHLLARRSVSLGQMVQARAELAEALALAERAGDSWRRAFSLSTLAYASARNGEAETAERLLGKARRIAAAIGDLALMARVRADEARMANAAGDRVSAARLTEEALALARRDGATRMEALLLGNLSDLYAKLDRPAMALQSAEAALVTVRRFNDLRAERILTNNAGLAKIGLGRIAEGKKDLARVIELWRGSGAVADEATTLREFGEALAAAGDARAALELYHRERALTADVARTNRQMALAEMQTRYDAEAKQRSIDLLNRDNALKSEALANRALLQQGWAMLVCGMAVSVVVALGLYRRVRHTRGRLETTEALLRDQSQRDALTNLANRRHLHQVMDATPSGAAFEGALLLVDIDHFKRINDEHGHAAGDAVLVEFGRRLTETVRAEDMVVRWGGEEFLIVAARMPAEQGHQLAARLLERISGERFEVQGRSLSVTASIGYGRFPLVEGRAALPWQQSVNLVDMALYSAKHEGRNRAMGIVCPSDVVPDGGRRVVPDASRFASSAPMELLQTCGSEMPQA